MVTAMRRAAWRDGAGSGWHDDLVWYAAAIHRMRALTPGLDEFLEILRDALTGAIGATDDPVGEMAAIAQHWDNPRSLGHQAQVHGTFVEKPDWPSHQGQLALWQECAHNHWFFLPWHRAYLVEFEAVVREHIRELGGPGDDWALPYWNYSDHAADPRRLGLPLPLRGDTLPDGVDVPGVDPAADGTRPNPLFNPTRLGPDEPAPNDVGWASATLALLRPHYANQQDTGRVSFGGGVLENPDNEALFHDSSQEIGQLDVQPHGAVHVQVNGAMALFQTAALDPVFWLHHCNIDRLWETYAHELGHGYPFENGVGVGTPAHESWTTRNFRFLRPDGSIRTWTAPDVLDIGALGYAYDTATPPPLPPVPLLPPAGSEVDPFGVDDPLPEPVAEAGPVSLAEELEVTLVGGGDADQDLGVDAFPDDARWVLRFDGIRSARPAPTSYHVYLGLQPGDDARPDDTDRYAGLLTLFGVYEASRDDGSSAADGQSRRLDVTAQVREQAATLRPLAVRIRLTPVNPDRDLSGARLSVGRIVLEFT
jgi:tyrosinase